MVFRADNVEVPAAWSQVAADVLAQKYFRKAGVPARLKKVEERPFPPGSGAPPRMTHALEALPEKERSVGEHSAKQVFERLAGTWTYWGWKGGYFDSEDDARAFFDELVCMLALQMAAPNSPQWFNTGLHWAYGIDGPSQGHFYVDFQTGKLVRSTSSYEHPQPHACFIQGIEDDLVSEGGIMDLCPARRACSSTAPARAPTSPPARPEASRCPAAGSPPACSRSSSRRPLGLLDQERRHHAPRRPHGDPRRRPPRRRASTSTGRSRRSRRSRSMVMGSRC